MNGSAVPVVSVNEGINNPVVNMQELDELLLELDITSATAAYGIDSCLAEIEDMLSYCNDILSSGGTLLCGGPIEAVQMHLVHLAGNCSVFISSAALLAGTVRLDITIHDILTWPVSQNA